MTLHSKIRGVKTLKKNRKSRKTRIAGQLAIVNEPPNTTVKTKHDRHECKIVRMVEPTSSAIQIITQLAKYPSVGRVSAMVLRSH